MPHQDDVGAGACGVGGVVAGGGARSEQRAEVGDCAGEFGSGVAERGGRPAGVAAREEDFGEGPVGGEER